MVVMWTSLPVQSHQFAIIKHINMSSFGSICAFVADTTIQVNCYPLGFLPASGVDFDKRTLTS